MINLNKQIDKLANGFYNISITDAHEQKICVNCKNKIHYTSKHGNNKEGDIYSIVG